MKTLFLKLVFVVRVSVNALISKSMSFTRASGFLMLARAKQRDRCLFSLGRPLEFEVFVAHLLVDGVANLREFLRAPFREPQLLPSK